MKEKGILGELQAFLRMKMVEKLQGTELTSPPKHRHSSERDDAINIMVYEFLKHHQMHYTLSVFASECLSIQKHKNLDNLCTSKDVLSTLGIRDMFSHVHDSHARKNQCLLDWLIDAFSVVSQKKSESKSCQYDLSCNEKKLMLNSQSQTDFTIPECTYSQTVQTCPDLRHLATQTEDTFKTVPQVSRTFSEEIEELTNQLEESQLALKRCQSKLRDSEKRIECLLSNRQERLLSNVDNHHPMISSTINSSVHGRRTKIFYHKRLQEAQNFLEDLNGRIQLLDHNIHKHQNIALSNNSVEHIEHLHALSDPRVSPLNVS